MRAFAPYISAFIVAGLAYWLLTRTGLNFAIGLLCALVVWFVVGFALENFAQAGPKLEWSVGGGLVIAAIGLCATLAQVGLSCLNNVLFNLERGLEDACQDAIWRNPEVFATLSAVGIGIGIAVCAGLIWLFGGDEEQDIGGR